MQFSRIIAAMAAQAGYVTARSETKTSSPAGIETLILPQTTANSTKDHGACGKVVAAQRSSHGGGVPWSLALACLESVPLDVESDLVFTKYVTPFIQFQSTHAYLKNPPRGYMVDGVDIFGGLAEITEKLKSGGYTGQYEFEKDLFILVNVLPYDFHSNLPLPLMDVFTWNVELDLVSVSADGISLPEVYTLADVQEVRKSDTILSWKPSPVIAVDSIPVADYLLLAGLQSQQFADPDGIYNKQFQPLPRDSLGGVNRFLSNAHLFGHFFDNTTLAFGNGSRVNIPNNAYSTRFSKIANGSDLSKMFGLPFINNTLSSVPSPTSPAIPSSKTNPLSNDSNLITLHQDSYIGGYFLKNSSVAVLAVNAFLDGQNDSYPKSNQQIVVKNFLAACKVAGKTNLILDLQGNSGGQIYNGYDTFKQLFPTVEPFGASRLRSTPYVRFLSKSISNTEIYNTSFSSIYQIQAVEDMDGQDFSSVEQFVGPYQIYGDNFTALARRNLSDPVQEYLNENISGYDTMTNIPPAVFLPEDIIMLHDGGCGSTCALFFEFMKSQGGVRSVAMGGRPQIGPMQPVAGTKGTQVLTYLELQQEAQELTDYYVSIGKDPTLAVPDIPPAFNISLSSDSHIGGPLTAEFRVNIRNNYNSTNPSDIPLQFIYEAANCRLFYTISDVFSSSGLWERVADVAWGNGKCVEGSTTNADNTISRGAYNTVQFDKVFMSNVSLPSTLPGFVKNNGTGPEGLVKRTSSGPGIAIVSTAGTVVRGATVALRLALLGAAILML